MTLSLSKSLFTKNSSDEHQNLNYRIRLLYKLESHDSENDWICSFINYSNLTYKYLNSNFTIPSHLKFAGFLIDSTSNFDLNNLESLNLNIDLKNLTEFYLLVLENDSNLVFSLNDSFSCYKISQNGDNQSNLRVKLDDIRWVEDDDSELKARNLMLINASVLFFSKRSFNEDSETNVTKPGVYKMEDLPNSLKGSLVDSLKSYLTKLKSDEPSCKLVYSEPFEQIKDKLSEFYPIFSLGFGFNSRGRKHVFIVCGEYEDSHFSFKLLIQNTVSINLEQSEEPLISKSVLDKTHDQLSKLYSYMTNDINNLSSYISISTEKNTQELFLNYFNEFPESDQKIVTRNSNPRSGNKSNKSKNVKSAPKTENKVKNKDKNKIFNVVPLLEMFGSEFALKLDATTGALSLALNKELPKVIDKDEENDKNTCLNLVFKFLMSSSNYTESVDYVPFGGTVVPFFDFSSHSNLSLDGVFENSSKLKTVFNPYDLVDKTILVSPHRAINAYPGWISPKKSTVSMVQGNYQYYHYTQMGVNDTGWGCCYRSLQLVCSWYLLGYHTTKLVPTHSKIQEVLKENDVSHKDLKVGSNTWIGTVECGYFLNWYLGYMYKTLYLNDVSEFRNYNVVIADHLKSQGTPVIVGAGAYAYVILGICVESEQGEVAYLIADPHYTGEDSIKNVVNKGGIGWKKVGFLSKASEGKFINLCLPLLEKYGV